MPDTLITCPVFDNLARALTGEARVQHIDGLPTRSYTPWTGGDDE